MQTESYTPEREMATPPYDPRDKEVQPLYPRAVESDDSVALSNLDRELRRPTYESVRRSREAGALEAVQAMCMAFPEAFEVLLHRDRLRDVFGDEALNKAFDRVMDERRRR